MGDKKSIKNKKIIIFWTFFSDVVFYRGVLENNYASIVTLVLN